MGRRMSRIAGWLLSLCLFSAPTLADGPVPVWHVGGEQNDIWLLGSVHMLRRSDHPLPPIMDRLYEQAEILLMELDMDDLDEVAMQALFQEAGLLPAGTTLADVLGPERYARASAAADAADIPLDMLAGSEPWLAALITEQVMLGRAGFSALHGIEIHFLGRALADDKDILGLETVAEQVGIFDTLAMADQAELLLQTLENADRSADRMAPLIDAWRRGDTAYLEETMLAEMSAVPGVYERLLVERNRRWIGTILELLDDDDDYLIIVGAAHLVGDDGVPALLRAHDLDVTQLRAGDIDGERR